MTVDRTHYEVLGIARHASTAEVHQAHRGLARMLHPDHLATIDLEAEDRRLAEQRIRAVNEAARVLGDPDRRARYDATLPDAPSTDLPWSPFPPGVDPDEDFSPRPGPATPRPSPKASGLHVARPTEDPPSASPLRVLVGIGVLILVGVIGIVALVGSGSHSGQTPTVDQTGVCVRVAPGPVARVVDCQTANDGRVVAFVSDAGACPPGSTVRRLSATDPDLACLEAVAPR